MKRSVKFEDSTAAASREQPERIEVTLTERPPDADLSAWDELVNGVPGSDVTQLSSWGTIRSVAGYRPLYVWCHAADVLLGGAVVLVRRTPVIGRIGYVAYGPVVVDGPRRPAVVAALADALVTLGRNRLRALFVQPLAGQDVTDALLERGCRRSTAGVSPARTVRIDLSVPEEKLRADLSKRVRRWTNKWADAGVEVRRGGPADLDVLIRLARTTARHQRFDEPTAEYVHTLYRELTRGGHVELFVGEVHGEPAVAELFTRCGGVLRCRLTGMDRSGAATALSVTAAVDWEAIRWAKKQGFAYFDFGGLPAEAGRIVAEQGLRTPDLDGASRFKVAFGGRLHEYPPAVELIASPILRTAYDRLASGSVGRAAVERVRRRMRRGSPTRAKP